MPKKKNKKNRITKLDAASRQLSTAVRLFFQDDDPISVFTLGQAALEIFDALCRHKNVRSFRHEILEAVPAHTPKSLNRLIEGPKNFFKHADRDPDVELINFTDRNCDEVLVHASEDCIKLMRKKVPLEADVYRLWYFSTYPHCIHPDAMPKLLPSMSRYFRGIHDMPRKAQKELGLRVLEALE